MTVKLKMPKNHLVLKFVIYNFITYKNVFILNLAMNQNNGKIYKFLLFFWIHKMPKFVYIFYSQDFVKFKMSENHLVVIFAIQPYII